MIDQYIRLGGKQTMCVASSQQAGIAVGDDSTFQQFVVVNCFKSNKF